MTSADKRSQEYAQDYDLVSQFKSVIESHRLGLTEARDALYRSVYDDTEEEDFAWRVVNYVTKESGAEGFCYDW
jgi:hypothetical protein